MSMLPPWPADQVDEANAPPARRALSPQFFALVIALLAAAGAAVLVLTTEPGPREERIFVALVLISSAGLGSIFARAFGAHTDRPLADSLRALRRGVLLGLAFAGAIVLQLNAALSPTNVAFLLLVLLIVEMVFLARRQHPV
jgi:hypothetical protein